MKLKQLRSESHRKLFYCDMIDLCYDKMSQLMKENDDTKNKYDQYDIQKLTPTFNKFIYFLLGCKNLIYIRIFNQFMMIHGCTDDIIDIKKIDFSI